MEEEAAAEKMAALKRAYAEIILNMAQESAARILVSERKALGFQQSLFAAKEEALAALLRLKSIMDSKISQAEEAQLVQVSRIQELELKLNEAGSTICHLRTEMKRVNGELEKLKNRMEEPLSEENSRNQSIYSNEDKCKGSITTSDHMISTPLELEPVLSEVEKTTLSMRNADSSYCFTEYATKIQPSKDISEENECPTNSDLASILMRSKEPELYRNGCTQRIRAFEQNLLTGKVPIRSEDNVSSMKIDLVVHENGKSEHTCFLESSKADDLESEVKKSAISEKDASENGQALKFFRRISSRRAKSKYINSTHSGISLDEKKVGYKPSNTESSSYPGDHLTADDDSLMKEDDKELLHSCDASFSIRSCRTSIGRKMHSDIALRNVSLENLQSSRRVTRLSIARQIHSDSEDQSSESPTLITGKGEDSLRVSNPLNETSTKDVVPLTRGIQDDPTDMQQAEDSVIRLPIQNIADSIDMTSSKPTDDSGHLKIANLDPKGEKIGTTTQGGGGRFLQYTFRRKRKREFSGGKDENLFTDKRNTSKRKALEKQNSMVELQNPSLITESSRDSRRVAQVARQLISLSEKRWC